LREHVPFSLNERDPKESQDKEQRTLLEDGMKILGIIALVFTQQLLRFGITEDQV